MRRVPGGIYSWRDFRGLDFRATSPEDVGVGNRDTNGGKVTINGGLVLQHAFFLRAVDDSHDIDITELRTALAPITMSHAVVATDLCASLDLATFWHCPVEQAIEPSDPFTSGGWLYVFEEGGEPANDFF